MLGTSSLSADEMSKLSVTQQWGPFDLRPRSQVLADPTVQREWPISVVEANVHRPAGMVCNVHGEGSTDTPSVSCSYVSGRRRAQFVLTTEHVHR